jgi:hypothetical protein
VPDCHKIGFDDVLASCLSHLCDRRFGIERQSNVTPTQIAQARQMCEIVCLQNFYNRRIGRIDDLARDGIA